MKYCIPLEIKEQHNSKPDNDPCDTIVICCKRNRTVYGTDDHGGGSKKPEGVVLFRQCSIFFFLFAAELFFCEVKAFAQTKDGKYRKGEEYSFARCVEQSGIAGMQ